jgi:hypothetical protein
MKTLEQIAIENGATKKCDACSHLEFPTTFCSGCGMYARIGSCECELVIEEGEIKLTHP